ncbi:hypothetical protein OIV83_002018 [Microbotryomycetes sp. JL201]|nr:hypothetical protein OIV83_002018 [Microbotryomycetes sp. JL201]
MRMYVFKAVVYPRQKKEPSCESGVTAQMKPIRLPKHKSVHFHVIRAGTALYQGNVPQSQIAQQMTVLNTDYASTGFQFVLNSTDYTTNSQWFNSNPGLSSAQTAMKKALRRGDKASLNIYVTNSFGGSLGYSTMPIDAIRLQDDGVTIAYSSLPGGSDPYYNLGKTTTHEVGHWMGLYHLFQNGCTGNGDYVSDTPAESSPQLGCPIGRDSCPYLSGKDMVNNFMALSDDSCVNTFTPGQIARMVAQVALYRGL